MKINTTLAIFVLAFLSACSSSSPYVPTAAEAKSAARTVDTLNSAKAPLANRFVTISDRITTQDILDVNVFKVPDLSAKGLTVESNGTISLPLIGTVKVAGLTMVQAEQMLTRMLTEYMQAPQVSVIRTNKAIEKRVTVEGEVKTPGVYPIKGNLSFLQAIALAQGLSDVGDSRGVFFYRDGTRHLVNLDLVRNGTISDPMLRGDDRIVVMKDTVKVREKRLLEVIPAVTSPFAIFY